VRHVRMLGLCLVAALIVSALGAGSALATRAPKYTAETWAQYKHCPYEDEEIEYCFAGITSGGANGGFFQYGKVKVKLNQPITLQGGFKGTSEALEVSPAVGAETLEAPPLKVTGGIGLFNKAIQEYQEWPAALRESWKEAKKNREQNVYAKIEMAGDECFEVPGCLDTTNILFEEGTAFRLPLKVTVSGPWLEKLGGGPCQIGSDEHPIHINLTTEGAGTAGELEANEPFTAIVLRDSRLVDVDWTIEQESAPKGCGGAYESYIDKSLSEVLEVYPGKKGIVSLSGSLYTANRARGVVTEGFESGELP
jgi:hypothetical protein